MLQLFAGREFKLRLVKYHITVEFSTLPEI
jgi:hypothetical protein